MELSAPGTHLRLLDERGVEQLQLSPYGIVVTNGVRGGAINDMHQHLAALCVAQELVPQANSSMRSLQQPCSTISLLYCTFYLLSSPPDHLVGAKLPPHMSQRGRALGDSLCERRGNLASSVLPGSAP